jgi:hypothetical protein
MRSFYPYFPTILTLQNNTTLDQFHMKFEAVDGKDKAGRSN